MGGYGSGRRYRWDAKPLVENYQRLDIRDLRKPPRPPSVDMLLSSSLTMAYEVKGEKLFQTLKLTWTPCHFGGRRLWFVCPCGRRVGILYFAGRQFRCRQCCGLAYASQNETDSYRALRRANKIREKLGGRPGPARAFPLKLKRMQWGTYSQLKEKHDAAYCESLFLSAFGRRLVEAEDLEKRIVFRTSKRTK